MPLTAPNTQGIVNEVVALLTNLKLADGVTNAYKAVVLGGEKNYVGLLPCAVVKLKQDDSQRHAHGGTIVEHLDIEIRSLVDYTVASTAETAIIAIRDALMPTLQKYATLQSTPNVYNAKVKPGSASFGFLWLKPNYYRAHTVELETAQYYVIQGGIQS